MKWKPYPRYKDSGVESLSLVPEKWRVMPLKHLGGGRAVSIQMGPFGSMLTNLASGPTGFRLFGQQNTISGDFTVGDRWLAEDDYHRLRKYALRPGTSSSREREAWGKHGSYRMASRQELRTRIPYASASCLALRLLS